MKDNRDKEYTDIDYPPITQKHPVLKVQCEEINKRIRFHIGITRRRSTIYHWTYRVLAWGIPIIAAIATVLSSGNIKGEYNNEVFYLSALITVLTSIYSTIHPHERRRHSTKYSNKFWSFHTDFPLGLEEAEKKAVDENDAIRECSQYIRRRNAELSQLIADFNN